MINESSIAAEAPKYKLLKAESIVITCNCCGHWLNRGPAFLGYEGEWNCERCNCTSIRIRPGRPFGPQSREWEWINKVFNEMCKYFDSEEMTMVTTDPPFRKKRTYRLKNQTRA